MKRTLFTIPSLILLALIISQAALAKAPEPVYGNGITVDGKLGDWNLETDLFTCMYKSGEPGSASPVLSMLYLRYDYKEGMLYALVLDECSDNELPKADPAGASIRIFDIGLPGETLIDGTGRGGTLPRSFQWVRKGGDDEKEPVIGFEACARLNEGSYAAFETSMSYHGCISSTGDHAQGNAIQLVIQSTPVRPDDFGAGDLPKRPGLSPNHPNPFNPVTTIRFNLEQAGPARLTVVDLRGRQVAVLADGVLAAGEHACSFNGSNLASGVYIYRLETAEATLSRRMILTK